MILRKTSNGGVVVIVLHFRLSVDEADNFQLDRFSLRQDVLAVTPQTWSQGRVHLFGYIESVVQVCTTTNNVPKAARE